ncbi:MAG: hypothetical protein ACYC4P_20560 [Thermoanaerobaculia bacterium]
MARFVWSEIGPEVFSLSPAAELQLFTDLSEARPPDQAWLATKRPIVATETSYELSISVAADQRFSTRLIDGFRAWAERFTTTYSTADRRQVVKDLRKSGQGGSIWSAEARLLACSVPARLLSSASVEIETLFADSDQPVDLAERD